MRNMTPPIIPKLVHALDTSNFRQFDDLRLDMDKEHGLGPDDLNASDPFREFESSTPRTRARPVCARLTARDAGAPARLAGGRAVSLIVPGTDDLEGNKRRSSRSGLALSTGDLRILSSEETAALMKEAQITPDSPMPLATDELDGVDDDEGGPHSADLDDEPPESAMLTGGDGPAASEMPAGSDAAVAATG